LKIFDFFEVAAQMIDVTTKRAGFKTKRLKTFENF